MAYVEKKYGEEDIISYTISGLDSKWNYVVSISGHTQSLCRIVHSAHNLRKCHGSPRSRIFAVLSQHLVLSWASLAHERFKALVMAPVTSMIEQHDEL
jgi:hypothetical protein